MKKNICLLLIIMSFILFSKNVNAGSVLAAENGSTGPADVLDSLKSGYTSNASFNITNSATITMYGKVTCSTGKCSSLTYQGDLSTYEEVLKSKAKCTNGEKYITIEARYGDRAYDPSGSNPDNLDGIIYFSEDYFVTCSANNTTGATLLTSSTSSSYSSSTTTTQSNTGITTYYIVLGCIALISYVFMIVVKKFNLFKNI